MQAIARRRLFHIPQQKPLLTLRTFASSQIMAAQHKLKLSSLDLEDGEKREVEVDGIEDSKVLLVKVGGKVHALGSKCTHYGAPLVKGVLGMDGRITCPWHGACFNVTNGDIEHAPAIDNLASYPLSEKNGEVYIEGSTESIRGGGRRIPNITCQSAQDSNGQVIIVGGGSGATGALEGLREYGFKGAITVISKEPYSAIDRTKLSKALISDPEKIALRKEDFYKAGAVNYITSTEVTGIDFSGKKVKDSKGKTYPYTHLILATGGTPRKLPLDGFKTLSNIFVLRTISDVKSILGAVGDSKGKKIAVIGSSFIGMEVANALAKDNTVTVVGMEKVPLERILGEKIGAVIQKKIEGTGVKFYMNASVSHATASESDSSAVGAVVLKDGTSIPADLVVLGVGVGPETSYLKGSTITLEKDQSIKVDATFSVPGYEGSVFAIGDIATYPYAGPGGGPDTFVRIEHWNVAQNAGRVVAKAIADPDQEARIFIPVFWSALGAQLRYCGHTPNGFDDLYIDGDEKEATFVVYYGKEDTVVAVGSMGKDPYVSMAAQLMFEKSMPSFKEIKGGADILKIGSTVGFMATAG